MRYVLLWLILLSVPISAYSEDLKASWYSYESLRREGTWSKGETMMANGKKFDEQAMTCACRLYPLGSRLEITNLETEKSVVVVVTDRIGKRFAKTRIDLSKGAFGKIADLKKGVVKIKVRVL